MTSLVSPPKPIPADCTDMKTGDLARGLPAYFSNPFANPVVVGGEDHTAYARASHHGAQAAPHRVRSSIVKG